MAAKPITGNSMKWNEVLRRTHWRTRTVCVVVIIAVVIFSFVLPGRAQEKSNSIPLRLTTHKHTVLMEKKLAAVQKVVEGVAREDFVKIQQQAQMLRLMSTEAAWNVIQTPDYVRMSEQFRGTTDQLKQAAKDRNIEAVGLAYVSLSISCVNCHRHARSELSRIGKIVPTPVGFLIAKGN